MLHPDRRCVVKPTGTVLVTGAANGIGRAVATLLAPQCDQMIVVDQDRSELATLRAELPCTVDSVPLDVSSPDYPTELRDALGAIEHLDSVFTFAGVMHTGTVQQSRIEDLTRVVQINLVGTIATIGVCLPLMGPGSGVVTASSAIECIALPRHSTYVASKAGVYGFTRTLANEMRHDDTGIQVSVAVIGGAHTGIMRRGTFAAGEDRKRRIAAFEDHVARSTPEHIAIAILRGYQRGRRVIHAGPDSLTHPLLNRIPGRYTRLPRRS